MNTALTIIVLAIFIFIIVFYLKRAKEKKKAQQDEHEKIKAYGESINEETRNKNKWKIFLRIVVLDYRILRDNQHKTST